MSSQPSRPERAPSHSLADLARLADVTPRTIRYYIAQGLLPSPEGSGPAARYGEGHLARLRLIRKLQRQHLPLAEIRARLEVLPDEQVVALAAESDTEAVDGPGADSALDYVRRLLGDRGGSPRPGSTAVPRVPATGPGRASVAPPAPQVAPGRAAPPAPQVAPGRAVPPAASSLLKRVAEVASRPYVPDQHPVREPLESQAPAGPSPEPVAPAAPAPAHGMPLPATLQPAIPAPSKPSGSERSTWERISLTSDVELHVRRPLDRPSIKRVDRLIRIARELFEEET
jgi:DNA-binding transcriptional MerR regulator